MCVSVRKGFLRGILPKEKCFLAVVGLFSVYCVEAMRALFVVIFECERCRRIRSDSIMKMSVLVIYMYVYKPHFMPSFGWSISSNYF